MMHLDEEGTEPAEPRQIARHRTPNEGHYGRVSGHRGGTPGPILTTFGIPQQAHLSGFARRIRLGNNCSADGRTNSFYRYSAEDGSGRLLLSVGIERCGKASSSRARLGQPRSIRGSISPATRRAQRLF